MQVKLSRQELATELARQADADMIRTGDPHLRAAISENMLTLMGQFRTKQIGTSQITAVRRISYCLAGLMLGDSDCQAQWRDIAYQALVAAESCSNEVLVKEVADEPADPQIGTGDVPSDNRRLENAGRRRTGNGSRSARPKVDGGGGARGPAAPDGVRLSDERRGKKAAKRTNPIATLRARREARRSRV